MRLRYKPPVMLNFSREKLFVGFLAVGFATAHATDVSIADHPLEEVIVTGTSITRASPAWSLPVQVFEAEDIARAGATSLDEFFRQVPAANSSGSANPSQASGTRTGGIATVSLRGLTSARTLVLINGKRVPVYGGAANGAAGSSVDIGAIPLSAIERVEVLKDGASAIYGSDAIAGVVNFILRQDFQGLQASAQVGTPTRAGGGTQELVSLYGGIGELRADRYNVNLGASFQHQSKLMGSTRPFATRYSPGYGHDVTSPAAFPANVAIPAGSTTSPAFPDCRPNSIVDVNFPNQCRFDNSPFDSLQPEQRRINVYASGALTLTETTQLYGDATYAAGNTTTTIQPVPLSYQNPLLPGNPYNAHLANLLVTQYPDYKNSAALQGTGAFLLPPTSSYYPAAFAAANNFSGQPLNLLYRDFANGLRNIEDIAHTVRLVGGLRGDIAGWNYDASIVFGAVEVYEELHSGNPLYSRIMPLLDSGIVNPFGPTTDPTALAAAQATEFRGQFFASRTSLSEVSIRASRQLFQLPAGPSSGAIGAEFRRETFRYDPAPAARTGDIAGQGGNQLYEDATRSVESAFVELDAPVLQGLELDAAARVDHYQAVGNALNPKVSLHWQPEPWLLLRGSAGTGFRAPSLTDLYASQAHAVTGNGTRDPIKCTTFDANDSSCGTQFTIITGGNPDLSPEHSTTFTLGTLVEPFHNFTLDIDSFWIFLRNQIVVGGLGYATILQNAQSATAFANLIQRDVNGTIVAIRQTNANLFKTNLSGIDLDVKYVFDSTRLGRLTLFGSGTFLSRYDIQQADGSWSGQLDKGLNQITNNGGVVPRWRHTLTALYEVGPFSGSITQNYQKQYLDAPSSITRVSRRVSPYDTIDARVSYSGLKSFRLDLGAKNVFDKVPPYANYASTTNNFIGGYDINYGDPRCRFFYFAVNYALRK